MDGGVGLGMGGRPVWRLGLPLRIFVIIFVMEFHTSFTTNKKMS